MPLLSSVRPGVFLILFYFWHLTVNSLSNICLLNSTSSLKDLKNTVQSQLCHHVAASAPLLQIYLWWDVTKSGLLLREETNNNNLLLLLIIFSVLSSDFIPEHPKLVGFLRGTLQLSLPFALLLLTSLSWNIFYISHTSLVFSCSKSATGSCQIPPKAAASSTLVAAPLHLVVHLVLSFLCCSAQSLFVLSYILVDLFIKDILKAIWQSLCWDVPFCCWRFSTWPLHLSTFHLKSLYPSSPSTSLSHCNQPILLHSAHCHCCNCRIAVLK